MKRINYLLALGMAFAGLFNLSSCQNDDDFENESEVCQSDKLGAQDGGDRMDSVVVLSFDTYTSPQDVMIASDTSYICVNSVYLAKIDKEITEGMYVDVWHGANESAFVVKVKEITRPQGSSYCKYTVERATFKDVLPVGTYNLSLDPYKESNQSFRLSDGRFNSAAYYRASDDTYHPVAYVYVDDNLGGSQTEQYVPLPFAGWGSPLVEDNPDNGSIGGKFIDITATTKFGIPLGDGCGNIGVDKLMANIHASMQLTLDLGWSWFCPYVKKFEATAGGGMEFRMDASLQFGKSVNLWNKDFPVMSFGHYVATFYVLCIPVSVDCEPQLVVTTTGNLQGQMAFTTSYHCSFDLQAGVGYYDGEGWKNLSYAKGESEFTSVKPILFGQATTNLGLMLKMPFRLYGCAGPNFAAGPQIQGVFKGVYDIKSNTISATANVDVLATGKIGADINVLGREFAKWETSVDFRKWHIWDGSWSIGDSDASDEEKEMVEKARDDYHSTQDYYQIRVNNLNVKQVTMDPTGTYAATLTARPTELNKMLGDYDLQVGDYVSLYYDILRSYKLCITSIEDYSPQSGWFCGCKIYHFRNVANNRGL